MLFVFLKGVAQVVGGGVGLQDVDVHVVVGLADGGVGGTVGSRWVIGGGGLCGCTEAGKTEGGGWAVGVVVVVGR